MIDLHTSQSLTFQSYQESDLLPHRCPLQKHNSSDWSTASLHVLSRRLRSVYSAQFRWGKKTKTERCERCFSSDFLKCARAQIRPTFQGSNVSNKGKKRSLQIVSRLAFFHAGVFLALEFATYHPSLSLLPCTYLAWIEPLLLVPVTQFQSSLPSRMQQRSSLKSQPRSTLAILHSLLAVFIAKSSLAPVRRAQIHGRGHPCITVIPAYVLRNGICRQVTNNFSLPKHLSTHPPFCFL